VNIFRVELIGILVEIMVLNSEFQINSYRDTGTVVTVQMWQCDTESVPSESTNIVCSAQGMMVYCAVSLVQLVQLNTMMPQYKDSQKGMPATYCSMLFKR